MSTQLQTIESSPSGESDAAEEVKLSQLVIPPLQLLLIFILLQLICVSWHLEYRSLIKIFGTPKCSYDILYIL